MNVESEQLTINGTIEYKRDEKLTASETKSILESIFGNTLTIENICNKKVFVCKSNGAKHILLTCQI